MWAGGRVCVSACVHEGRCAGVAVVAWGWWYGLGERRWHEGLMVVVVWIGGGRRGDGGGAGGCRA